VGVFLPGVGSGLGVEEGAVVAEFGWGGFASEGAEVELLDRDIGIFFIKRGGEEVGPLDNLRVVHEEEGLGGDGGAGAAPLAGEGFGLIEDLHHGDEAAALDHEVDTAAALSLIEGAGAEHFWVELSGGGKDRVADDFRFEATGREARKEFVFGVEGGFF